MSADDVRAKIDALVAENEAMLNGLAMAVPEQALMFVQKSIDIAAALRRGIHEAEIEKDVTEWSLFEIGKTIYLSNREGFLLVSVPDDVVRRMFEILGSPKETVTFFRSVPEARVVIFGWGRTAVALHYDDKKMGKA